MARRPSGGRWQINGGLGYSLQDWLDTLALPEEANMADVAHARAWRANLLTDWYLTAQQPPWFLARISLKLPRNCSRPPSAADCG